ncbi:hypothetical protein [Flavobacterium aurantiibacter]|uniref:Uncharacterized protein n=1 Tax=Flavobacterium aurantiibacter TaxID=2023067 RepID=A0A256A2P5_9FLAO|nr:hypothetical protein [Flavobacterium aurantiibacter]OYQ47405.1 hypothetical protein CHX27_03265 [Flavobacterium aurantiibacter]
MKVLVTIIGFFCLSTVFGQADCKWDINVTDSLGTYRETKSYLVHERIFDGKQTFLSFKLLQSNGTPILHYELIEKTKDFSKAVCFDASSRIYLQLQNGKIITLHYASSDMCSNLVQTGTAESARILAADFLFTKGSIELLRESPVILMRVKYTTETTDIILKKQLKSELTGNETSPESFFSLHLPCLDLP